MDWKIILSLLIGLICLIGATVRAESYLITNTSSSYDSPCIHKWAIASRDTNINRNSDHLQFYGVSNQLATKPDTRYAE